MDPIKIGLQSDGIEAVQQALKGVLTTIKQIDKELGKASPGSKERIKGIKEEYALREQLSKKAAQKEAAFQSVFLGGGGGNSAGGIRRATRGPSIREASGGFTAFGSEGFRGASGIGNLTSTLGKIGLIGAAFSVLKGGLDMATDALKQFGGFLISDIIKPAFSLETSAQQLANATGGRLNKGEIISQVRALGLSHNIDPSKMLEATNKMIGLGFGDSPKEAFKLADTLATISKSRGTDIGDLGELAASIKSFDPTASAEDIGKLLMTQVAQGDTGSVVIEQIAKLGGKLTAPAADLAGNTDIRLASVGALYQSGRKGFGSTEELATAVGSLIGDIASKKVTGADKMLTKEGKIGDVAQTIGNIFRSTGGDAKKITDMKFSDPAKKLIRSYSETFAKAGGGEEGAKAVEALIKSFQEANTSLKTEKENERKVLQTSGEKWDAAVNRLKDKMLDIMPSVDRFVDKISRVDMDKFGSALVKIADVMIKVADILFDIFVGDKDVDQQGNTKGEYRMNLATGQMEFVKQSEIDKYKISPDSIVENYDPKKHKLTSTEEIISQDKGLAGFAAPATGQISESIFNTISTQGNGTPPAGEQSPDPKVQQATQKTVSELDKLTSTAKNATAALDKLSEAGVDVARFTNIANRNK